MKSATWFLCAVVTRSQFDSRIRTAFVIEWNWQTAFWQRPRSSLGATSGARAYDSSAHLIWTQTILNGCFTFSECQRKRHSFILHENHEPFTLKIYSQAISLCPGCSARSYSIMHLALVHLFVNFRPEFPLDRYPAGPVWNNRYDLFCNSQFRKIDWYLCAVVVTIGRQPFVGGNVRQYCVHFSQKFIAIPSFLRYQLPQLVDHISMIFSLLMQDIHQFSHKHSIVGAQNMFRLLTFRAVDA